MQPTAKQPTWILASASPRRRELLAMIGIDPVIMPTDADETIPQDICTPEDIVMHLSRVKAHAVTADQIHPHLPAILLAADTIVWLDNRVLGKPADARDAVAMLHLLSGKVHTVYTGVTMQAWTDEGPVRENTFFEATRVHVAALSHEEIETYVASGEPLDKAGSYGIQGLFARHIVSIDGDYANVVGLPVHRVYEQSKSLFRL